MMMTCVKIFNRSTFSRALSLAKDRKDLVKLICSNFAARRQAILGFYAVGLAKL